MKYQISKDSLDYAQNQKHQSTQQKTHHTLLKNNKTFSLKKSRIKRERAYHSQPCVFPKLEKLDVR